MTEPRDEHEVDPSEELLEHRGPDDEQVAEMLVPSRRRLRAVDEVEQRHAEHVRGLDVGAVYRATRDAGGAWSDFEQLPPPPEVESATSYARFGRAVFPAAGIRAGALVGIAVGHVA